MKKLLRRHGGAFQSEEISIEGLEQDLAVKRILPHLSSDEEFVNMFIAEAKLAAPHA